ncbi:shikimate kinase [Campylobacter insulaenigrae]|uniref:Shikimate kinase n=2 Tax=Campylobacter insulaenigrae TaxID=260714 RepID=A0A0A8GZU3_9BACT|nr:shikimate kinase [Campylobacter insulaenigrae]AJC87443.1 shikimate kinase [Campylobacter insulaenigrae NCTC 12927]MCR6570802.1 AAA family ATPase [Campylobacter insulaenigrae]MCR6572541.1 AAA family ATPase [Campylobacter insulaenigrae]MCR6573510.1 AAA family ATPase [Campylobacter insulaenigrae]MCR6576913.1 AAA family ATPase [Campylobacter insulaenigrae]
MNKKDNFLFVGFMGCGKTTIARAYAQRYDKFFIDTDELIKNKFNLEVHEIFSTYGESFFRNEEKKILHFLQHIKNSSIASGGGFIKQKKINEIGVVIYLKSTFEFIIKRLDKTQIHTRPLLSNLANAKILFDQRIQKYEKKADLIIDIENKEVEDIISQIHKEVK